MDTVVSSSPQFANIVILVLLVNSMFAATFVQVFGVTRYGARLSETANFETFSSALYTCYQMEIQDEWMDIMDDVSIEWPYCTHRFDSNYVYNYTGPVFSWGDCGSPYARFFFVAFKFVCEYIVLNLFIGVILEKFGFIADEISKKEDAAWTGGPSARQFQEFADNFSRFAAGGGSISVQAACTSLLFLQPIPLGFRHAHEVEYEGIEAAAQRLIRAELNVLARRRRERAAAFRRDWVLALPLLMLWDSAAAALAARRGQARFVNGVTFREVATVLLHWRKPSLIPDSVKLRRAAGPGPGGGGPPPHLREVLVTAAALVITDFFRRIIAASRRTETTKQLRASTDFRRWVLADPSAVRRTIHYARVRTELARFAALRRLLVPRLLRPASASVLVRMEPAGGATGMLPEGACSHVEAVEAAGVRQPRPVHGMDAFRRQAAEGDVLVRFVDGLNGRLGMYRLDMRRCVWKGWHVLAGSEDHFLLPRRIPGSPEDAVNWTQIDLAMPAVPGAAGPAGGESGDRGRRSTAGGLRGSIAAAAAAAAAGLAHDAWLDDAAFAGAGTVLWTLLDVQSFVVSESSGSGSGGPATPDADDHEGATKPGGAMGAGVSVVRLNVGSKSNVARLERVEQRETILAAVLEVVGYVPAPAGAPGPGSMAPVRTSASIDVERTGSGSGPAVVPTRKAG